MRRKPIAGEARDFVERTGLFEQMRSAGYDRELVVAVQLCGGVNVQVEDHLVVAAHDEQGRRLHRGEGITGEIRSAAT